MATSHSPGTIDSTATTSRFGNPSSSVLAVVIAIDSGLPRNFSLYSPTSRRNTSTGSPLQLYAPVTDVNVGSICGLAGIKAKPFTWPVREAQSLCVISEAGVPSRLSALVAVVAEPAVVAIAAEDALVAVP